MISVRLEKCFFVSLPIGNIKDISLRAVENFKRLRFTYSRKYKKWKTKFRKNRNQFIK